MIYGREGAWEAGRANGVQSGRGEVTQAESRARQHPRGQEAGRGATGHRHLGRGHPMPVTPGGTARVLERAVGTASSGAARQGIWGWGTGGIKRLDLDLPGPWGPGCYVAGEREDRLVPQQACRAEAWPGIRAQEEWPARFPRMDVRRKYHHFARKAL